MIDVRPEHLAEIKRILAEYAPGCEVRAFGSRVNGRAKPFSDLDLAIVGREKSDWRFIERLKDAFAASDLPFMVDVIDWNDAAPQLKELIEKKHDVLASG